MATLSAHLGYLFPDLPLEQRFPRARDSGFTCVEHPAPFAIPAATLRGILDDTGLKIAQISSGMGQQGEKGLASLPGREAEFHDDFARALDYAEDIHCPFVHAMAGVNGTMATYLNNLDVAQKLSENRAPNLLIEAISDATVAGYFMSDIATLIALAQERGFKVLIDTFHTCATGYDPAEALLRAGASLGHVHIADFPGRAEPATGTIDFAAVHDALHNLSYAGAIGFEYVPSGPNHLDWLPQWGQMFGGA
ncbi:TIM barrel protein [Phaeobacter sp. J2-8]|uniref:TIM barrel protein n=1 Tax=Phaeobacter sp. J2-8 TaxID=2931394 RepID=UPI001FD4E3F0|nr:TIM barrel protein [Phaeobacter sp. J2-8]MCJ7873379.1 TIM barrel protein [Phaeobacter sp. J2-8]